MSDFVPGFIVGAFLTAFSGFMLFVDDTTTADKFAIDYQANEFAKNYGFTRYVCALTNKKGYNKCHGLLDHGMVVDFKCQIDPTVECRLDSNANRK